MPVFGAGGGTVSETQKDLLWGDCRRINHGRGVENFYAHRQDLSVRRGQSVVRGQFRGYRREPGVAADSQVETFAALRLEIDSWRWAGVPFYLRAGKCLPVPCSEVLVKLMPPPRPVLCAAIAAQTRANFFRFPL